MTPAMSLRPANPSARALASHSLLAICFEHGAAILDLIESGHHISALGLVRLQYEALVRGIWALSVATDKEIEKLTSAPSEDDIAKLPMVVQMLDAIRGKVPPGIQATLDDFRNKTLRSLNSFVHSGEHAVGRHLVGCPEPMLRQVLVASNGLRWLAAFETAAIAEHGNTGVALYGISTEYGDCLPSPSTGGETAV